MCQNTAPHFSPSPTAPHRSQRRKREHKSQSKTKHREEEEAGAEGVQKSAHRADCAQAALHQVLEPSIAAGQHQGANSKGQGLAQLSVTSKGDKGCNPSIIFHRLFCLSYLA